MSLSVAPPASFQRTIRRGIAACRIILAWLPCRCPQMMTNVSLADGVAANAVTVSVLVDPT